MEKLESNNAPRRDVVIQGNKHEAMSDALDEKYLVTRPVKNKEELETKVTPDTNIRTGWQTASRLRKVLLAHRFTIIKIVKHLLATDPSLKDEVQRAARVGKGKFADAYSPRMVELIKGELGNQIRAGYKTGESLKIKLKTDPQKILFLAEHLLATDPSLKDEVQWAARVGKGRPADAYSPRMVELIRQHLESGRFRFVTEAGYITKRQLRKTLSTSREAITSAVDYLLDGDANLEHEIKRGIRNKTGVVTDAYSPRMVKLIKENIEKLKGLEFASMGYILQYAVEVVLKIINNKNFLVEKQMKTENEVRRIYPDLMYEYEEGRKVIFFDIKLRTTTESIEEDKKRYAGLIKDRYPFGGSVVFLCLSGRLPKKESIGIQIKVRYYHILSFLNRIVDNTKNTSLLNLISIDGNQVGLDLNQNQIAKIKEIIEQLEKMRHIISARVSEQENTQKEQEIFSIRSKMRILAKSASPNEIMSTNFKEILNF